ncbi:von Hippel-Lindau disease tumor suppressor-like [Bacillus rossius redtenbacheri]|uniref:von Hippel-Lindau disease tumor suppressor-like n=1 Tax=Bacillus rossius redtenbacheri TaxID=93214 RepID=UPI002FDE36E7
MQGLYYLANTLIMSARFLAKKYGEEQLRSKVSAQPCYLRFFNSTEHSVFLLWADYKGRLLVYRVLPPSSHCDVNTYATHPWLFLRFPTFDPMVVDREEVYFVPEPCGRQSTASDRTEVFITNPLLSLRRLALRSVRNALSSARGVALLELPRGLQRELAQLLEEDRERRRDLGLLR